MKLLRRLLRNQPVKLQTITTDGLASYGAALDQLELRHLHRPGRLRENNRVENSHLPIRRREDSSSGSNPKPQPKDFSPPTQRSTTPSIPNSI